MNRNTGAWRSSMDLGGFGRLIVDKLSRTMIREERRIWKKSRKQNFTQFAQWKKSQDFKILSRVQRTKKLE